MLKKMIQARLTTKGYFLVVTTFLSMSLLAVVALQGLREEAQVLQSVASEKIPQLESLAETNAHFQEAHMQLYRTLAWATSGIEGEPMETQYEATANAFAVLSEMNEAHLAGTENPILAQIGELLPAYLDDAGFSLELALFDPAGATMIANNANDVFMKMAEVNSQTTVAAKSEIFKYIEENRQSSKQLASLYLMLVIISLVFTTALTLLTIRSVTRPIVKVTQTMKQLAENNLDVLVEGAGQKNELGMMADAVLVFRDNAIEQKRLQLREKELEQKRIATEKEAIEQEKEAIAKKQEREEREREKTQARADEFQKLQNELGFVISAARNGDFSQRVSDAYTEESLVEVGTSVNALVNSVSESLEHTVKFINSIAHGDLRAQISGEFSGAFEELQSNSNAAADILADTINDILWRAKDVLTQSEEISTAMQDLSKRSEHSAANLEVSSASLRELTTTVTSNSQRAGEAEKLVQDSLGEAGRSSQIVNDAVDAMAEIERYSAEISKAISIIHDVAFQTNLLALNAGVEAARAGESGRGFAVVATEVRALAQRSAEAARGIDDLIQDSSKRVESGVSLVRNAGDALSGMSKSVTEISVKVLEIVETSREQASGIKEINDAVSQLDGATKNNVALMEEMTAANSSLTSVAEGMMGSVSKFQTTETSVGTNSDATAKIDASSGGASTAA